MGSAADTPTEFDDSFPAPARFLYGEVMIPVYAVFREKPEKFEPWAGG
jgi:hypothetical protein